MALTYRVPGTTVSQIVSPSISPQIASPATVGLVGLSAGLQTVTDQVRLVGTTPVVLASAPADATLNAVSSVKDALDPSKGAGDGTGYVVTSDYTVNTTNHTVTRVGGGAIADGAIVNITYTYTEARYFDPVLMRDFPSITSRFGPALNSDGTVASALSFGALVAFENGASELVLQPLFKRATPGDTSTAKGQPDATQAAAITTWQDSLVALRDAEEVNVLVPVVGQSQANVSDGVQLSIIQAAQDHVNFMASNDQLVVVVYGEDSSASGSVATKATLRSHAATLRGRYGKAFAQCTVGISPSKFTRPVTTPSNTLVYVGGQYAACAVAGMLASRAVSDSLTSDVVSSFKQVISSQHLKQDKNDDAAAGLLVLENRRDNVVVRHGITLDDGDSSVRELSVVRAKHRMVESLQDTLNSQIIGQINADDNAPLLIRSTVGAVLEELRLNRDIVSYKGVEVTVKTLEPTEFLVRFDYRPAFPVNYITVQFSIDINSGNLSLSQVAS